LRKLLGPIGIFLGRRCVVRVAVRQG
jgi:hypothetical protein